MKDLLFYPHQFSALKTKLAGKVKSYANTGHFFFAASPKYSGMRTKTIPLTYFPQLRQLYLWHGTSPE